MKRPKWRVKRPTTRLPLWGRVAYSYRIIAPYEAPPSPHTKPHYRQTQNPIIAPYKQREPAKNDQLPNL